MIGNKAYILVHIIYIMVIFLIPPTIQEIVSAQNSTCMCLK